MPNIRIKNTAPNIQSKSLLPNIRATKFIPNILSRNIVPNQRTQIGGSVTTYVTGGVSFGGLGYLIGMLGMTYTIPHTTPLVSTTLVSNLKPNLRVTNG